jgi:hypothetical protein
VRWIPNKWGMREFVAHLVGMTRAYRNHGHSCLRRPMIRHTAMFCWNRGDTTARCWSPLRSWNMAAYRGWRWTSSLAGYVPNRVLARYRKGVGRCLLDVSRFVVDAVVIEGRSLQAVARIMGSPRGGSMNSWRDFEPAATTRLSLGQRRRTESPTEAGATSKIASSGTARSSQTKVLMPARTRSTT